MRLRTRLSWAFAAVLLVPLLMLFLAGGLVHWLENTGSGSASWSLAGSYRVIGVFNELVLEDPLLPAEPTGFERLAEALPPGVSLGLWVDGHWVRSTPGFDFPASSPHPRTKDRILFTWKLPVSVGADARLEARWSPRMMAGTWGGWALAGLVGLVVLLVVTNGVLTSMVSRSVLRPLAVLEAAARRLGEGDLEPGPLPQNPPEFRQLGLAFDDLRRRLKDSLESRQALEEERQTWVASVSHDLRSPLAVLRGYSEGLRDGVAGTPEKRERYQAVILARVVQMERLVDDLFQWARWDWGEPRVRLQPLDLVQELREAAEVWSTEGSGLEVAMMTSDPLAPLVADPMALRRIFDNLARNAAQHAGPNPKLEVGLTNEDGFWLVSFRDRGPGMSPEILPRVFERFYRGDPARNPAQGGGGLGLTIARTLARSLGGDVDAANHPEGGALFTVRLPQAAPEGGTV